MSIRLTTRRSMSFLLLACSLSACGHDLGTRATPLTASEQTVAQAAGRAGEPCGSVEQPCLLPGIRVVGAAYDQEDAARRPAAEQP
ncbi:MAG TPA: hypothetical protein VF263_18985 [Longimicrobiaceae bacterium]